MPDLLLDLNVILDLLQDRSPHGQDAEELFKASAASRVRLWVSADAPSTLFFLLERALRKDGRRNASLQAQAMLRKLLGKVLLAPVDGKVLEMAFAFGMEDFEDAIQAASAVACGVRTLVTRDAEGFADLPPDTLAVLTPGQALAII